MENKEEKEKKTDTYHKLISGTKVFFGTNSILLPKIYIYICNQTNDISIYKYFYLFL